MKSYEIDFAEVREIHKIIKQIYAIKDYKKLREFYLNKETEIAACLEKYRGKYREIRIADFTKLNEDDFKSEGYILNRLYKTNLCLEKLLSYDPEPFE